MSKKRLNIFAAVMIAVLITAALFLLIFFAFQKSRDQKLIEELSSVALELPDGFTVTAADGSMNTQENSFLSARTGFRSGANLISLNVSFRPDGVPVLAKKLRDANDNAVTLIQIFEYMKDFDDVSVLLNLRQLTNPGSIEELVQEYGYMGRVFYTGVTDTHAAYLQRTSPGIPFYLDILPATKTAELDIVTYYESYCESAMNLNAVGLRCESRYVSQILVDTVRGYGLRLAIYGVDKEVDMYRMLSFGVDNIETAHPDVLLKIITDWKSAFSPDVRNEVVE